MDMRFVTARKAANTALFCKPQEIFRFESVRGGGRSRYRTRLYIAIPD